MQSRIVNSQYNKCTKDYYRLNFIKKISELNIILDKNNNKNLFIENIIKKVMQIYKKDNPNIFKLPYSICSLEKTDNDKKQLYKIYEKFLNLNVYEQFDIFTKGNFITNDEKNIITNIIHLPS